LLALIIHATKDCNSLYRTGGSLLSLIGHVLQLLPPVLLFGLAIGLYSLQDRTSKDVKKLTERIDKLTQQKAKAEQDKKAFECRKIIEHLQVIQDAERV
jgi:hypothetical protein